jgi:hypothetical protein
MPAPAPRRLATRGRPLIEEAAERSRVSARARVTRVREAGRSLVQVAVAVTAAWLLAHDLIGHVRPFFAPVAAIITLGLSLGERRRRAIEVALGVTVGIAVADVLVSAVGTGAWQLALVVSLTMAAAQLLGSGRMFTQQAAVSAVLVATLQPPSAGITFARAIDALVGGAVALLVNAVVFPANPLRLVREAAGPVLGALAAALDELADAVLARDRDAVHAALMSARAIEGPARALHDTLAVGRDTARIVPTSRGSGDRVDAYAEAAGQIDLAVRNVRVLARAARRAVEVGDAVPPEVAEALRELGTAVRALDRALADPGSAPDVRVHALRAAAGATVVLERTANMSVSTMVAILRAAATDLMRGTGMSYEEAADAVRAAAREALDRYEADADG